MQIFFVYLLNNLKLNKMETLIKMTDYVKEQYDYLTCDEASPKFVKKVINYANLLSLTPEKWMFIACDSEGNVLEEPTHNGKSIETFSEVLIEYKQAKKRCYFEGFECDGNGDGFIYLKKDDLLLIFDNESKTLLLLNSSKECNIYSIEDLIPFNLTLTAAAQKEFGL